MAPARSCPWFVSSKRVPTVRVYLTVGFMRDEEPAVDSKSELSVATSFGPAPLRRLLKKWQGRKIETRILHYWLLSWGAASRAELMRRTLTAEGSVRINENGEPHMVPRFLTFFDAVVIPLEGSPRVRTARAV